MDIIVVMTFGILVFFIIGFAITLNYLNKIKYDCKAGIHCFEPVYDIEVGKPNVTRLNGMFPDDMERVINASRESKKTYVKSVCKFCGKTIHKED